MVIYFAVPRVLGLFAAREEYVVFEDSLKKTDILALGLESQKGLNW